MNLNQESLRDQGDVIALPDLLFVLVSATAVDRRPEVRRARCSSRSSPGRARVHDQEIESVLSLTRRKSRRA